MRLLRSLLLPALAACAVLLSPADAQCLTPDYLDVGSACGGAQTFVPQHAFGQQALGLCWQNCGLAAQANYIAKWGAAVPSMAGATGALNCGWYEAQLRIFDSSGTLVLGGTMTLTYARTWVEGSTAGTVNQVWRYLVNGDLRSATNTPTPCGIPPCAMPNGNRVRFTVYVDYAFDCLSGLTEHAWMLTHACDAIDHAPGFPRAGSFHPGRDYTFVGPAAGFVPAVSTGTEAGVGGVEAMRKWDATVLPARCGNEEPLLSGSITAGASVCMCAAGPANWFQGQLVLAGGYGSVLAPFPGSDPFRSFAIGQWTNPTAYPGVEEVRWNCSEEQWIDCSGVGRQEYYYGVTTIGGEPAYSFNVSFPSAPLGLTFIDQSNSALLPGGTATRNRPFRSDHVFNLNF